MGSQNLNKVWVREIRVDMFGLVPEKALEEITCPVDRVLNFVGEMMQCANWNRFFWRVRG